MAGLISIFLVFCFILIFLHFQNNPQTDVDPTTTQYQRALYQPDRGGYGNFIYYQREYNRTCIQENKNDLDKIQDCVLSVSKIEKNYEYLFKNLPELPENFWSIKSRLMSEKYVDICSLGEDYWKQPEFISNTWLETGIDFYKRDHGLYWYPVGYGSFPVYQYVTANKGDEFNLCCLVHTSWGVSTYQGLGITPIYLNKIKDIKTGKLIEMNNSEIGEEYIELNITPTQILIEPTYPQFGKNWIQKIEVKVKLSGDIPEGKYGIGFGFISPSKEISEEIPEDGIYIPLIGIGPSEYPFQAEILIN